MKHTNYLANMFEYVSEIINGAEKSFLNLLSAITPYCVPIIPAYLTYYHTMNEMDFPQWVAISAAFVVEVLGIVSVSTAIRFQRNNTLYKDAKNKAPLTLAIFTYVFYISIVLSVNVLLEVVTGARSPAVIWAIGLFSLLSLPSAILISIRSQYSEMLEEKRAIREEKRVSREAVRRAFASNTTSATLEDVPTGGKFQR